MSEPWTHKHQPSLTEIYGQDRAVDQILNYVKNWRRGLKPLLLYGDSGTGKTATVVAVANKLNCELIELNASDSRNADAITTKALSAATQASLFGTKKIILLDEIDGLYGRVDRGAVPVVKDLIQKTQYPLILTANDPYRKNIRSLKDKCESINFSGLDYRLIANRLEEIAKLEKISVSKDVLQSIARRCGGDMRSAIMDFQSIATGRDKITEKDIEMSTRDQVRGIQDVLKMIFKSSSIDTAIQAMNESDKDPDELFLWVRENLPHEYSGQDLANAYEVLSRADLFRGRIRRQQYWGYLRYTLELISAGVSASKTKKNPAFVKYKMPSIMLKYGRYRFTRAYRDSLTSKIGAATHSSKQDVLRSLPYYRILTKDKGFRESFTEKLQLDDSELKYLTTK
ncbi:replication factor C large subunit [Candidatus Undinarchaeota archaeon]